MMSSAITQSIVHQQLSAMRCERFELGVLYPDGWMKLRQALRRDQIERLINWLRRENARGAHIFIRPEGPHALSLIDDLSFTALAEMKQTGFEPAVVVETSPNNFQA